MADRQYSLKELRARENKTQKELAEDLQVAVQTYNAWEKDLTNTTVANLQKIAKHFGLKLDDIKLVN